MNNEGRGCRNGRALMGMFACDLRYSRDGDEQRPQCDRSNCHRLRSAKLGVHNRHLLWQRGGSEEQVTQFAKGTRSGPFDWKPLPTKDSAHQGRSKRGDSMQGTEAKKKHAYLPFLHLSSCFRSFVLCTRSSDENCPSFSKGPFHNFLLLRNV